jgi:hypothetical protein
MRFADQAFQQKMPATALLGLEVLDKRLLDKMTEYGSYTIVPLKLDFAAEKGGMAVSAVWRLVYFLAPSPSDRSTQARRAVPLY